MKPINLKMTAFGSYAKETEIDFTSFGSDLYLITGDTGAGKTTIFDAIMIALFGEASGKAESKDNNRSFEKLHSDHVGKDTKSEVELVFLQNGRIYTVTRTLSFTKKQGKKDEYGASKITAVLKEPDKDPITGNTAVTARIKEIIGMDGEKFRKVVMLAQGEFKKFLQADSDTKGAILGELFDSSVYMYYQNLLKATRDKLSEIRKDYTNEVNSAMSGFQNPDESNEDYFPGSPKLVEALLQLLEDDKKKDAELVSAFRKADQAHNDLIKAYENAKMSNADLDELKKAQDNLQILEEQRKEIEELEKQVQRVSDALYQVRPKKDNRDRCQTALTGLLQDIELLKGRVREKESAVAQAKAICDADESNKTTISNLTVSGSEIEKTFAEYEKLSEAGNQKAKALDDLDKTSKRLEAETASVEKLTAQIAESEEELKKYKSVDEDLSAANESRIAMRDKLQILERKESGAIDRFRDIRTLEGKLTALREEAEILLNQQKNAFDIYSHKNKLFMEGQAGILAEKLGKTLEEKGEAFCPVCCTPLRKEDVARLARKQEATPSEDEVKEAQDAYEEACTAYGNKDKEIEGIESQANANKAHLLQTLQTHCPEIRSWEELADATYLQKLQRDWRAENTAALQKYETAREAKEKAVSLANSLEEARKTLNSKKEQIDAFKEAVHNAKQNLTAADTAITTLTRQLAYESEEAARKAKAELDKQKAQLERIVEDHAKIFEREAQAFSGLKGSLDSKKEQIPQMEDALKEAELALSDVLKEYAFESPETAEAVIAAVEQEAISVKEWLAMKGEKTKGYHVECEINEAKRQELLSKTEGKVKVDLTALQSQTERAESEKNKANEESKSFGYTLTNHEQTLSRVSAAKINLAGTDKAWSRIDRLGSLAAATNNTEGGRLTFERYVMGSVFGEILDMANQRLDLMTGGKYALVHRLSGGRANGMTGFNINVLDHTTMKERPSETLSGGESFMASLALALGLSDVVQNHEGGVQIDSLFIDEGFGSLDEGVLDKAMEVLKQLTEGNRLVGIISHVAKLESSIPDQICVNGSESGSTISFRH